MFARSSKQSRPVKTRFSEKNCDALVSVGIQADACTAQKKLDLLTKTHLVVSFRRFGQALLL